MDVRVPLVGRVLLVGFAAGFLGFALFGVVYSIFEGAWAGLGTAAIFTAWGLGAWRMGTTRLRLEGDTFIVRSYLKTTRVSVSDVDRFDVGSGYYGIDLLLRRSFQTLKVNAIQKSNWATWTGKTARADVLVEKLNDLVREMQGRASPAS